MRRRVFMKWTAMGVVTCSIAPLYADNILVPWHTKALDDAVKKMYGGKKIIWSDKIIVKTPRLASNGGSVPVGIKSDLDAKKIMVFSAGENYMLLGTYYVPKDAIVDYMMKIKLRPNEHRIVVILEDREGNIYSNATSFKIEIAGGCES